MAEHVLTTSDLIWPLFLIDGVKRRAPVASMPGVDRLSVDEALREAERAVQLGIPAIAFFPYTEGSLKDEEGSEAFNERNLVCRACRAVKKEFPGLGLITDVALDPYTSHGHDGLMSGETVLNDETVAALMRQALNQARAGADIVAPSDMMDGRVARDPRRARRAKASSTCRSWPTRPNTLRPSTGRSATPSARRAR